MNREKKICILTLEEIQSQFFIRAVVLEGYAVQMKQSLLYSFEVLGAFQGRVFEQQLETAHYLCCYDPFLTETGPPEFQKTWLGILLVDVKSYNLQYNTLVRQFAGTNDSSSKRLIFQVLFFFHNFLQNLLQKWFQFIFL